MNEKITNFLYLKCETIPPKKAIYLLKYKFALREDMAVKEYIQWRKEYLK